MKNLLIMLRVVAGVVVLVGITGCMILPVEGKEDAIQWVSAREVITLKALYDYSVELRQATKKQRIAEYKMLTNNNKSSPKTVNDKLRLALLLSGAESSITNYKKAEEELVSAYLQAAVTSPLVAGYIRMQLDALQQLNRQRSKARRAQRRSRRLAQQKQSQTKAQQPTAIALQQTFVDGPSAQAATMGVLSLQPSADVQRPSVAEQQQSAANQIWQLELEQALKSRIDQLERQLDERDTTIGEQDKRIEGLEAKIQALSVIEQKLKQKTQQE